MFPHGFVAKPLGEKARRFSGACPTLLTRQRWFLNGKLRLLRCGCMDWSSDKSKHANLALAKKRGKSFCCCKKAFVFEGSFQVLQKIAQDAWCSALGTALLLSCCFPLRSDPVCTLLDHGKP